MKTIDAYFGSKISPNMTRTEENYLICHNVPIARTGWYEYQASEIGVGGDEVINVYRSEDEVFSKAAMASYESKIVTNEHPPDLLTSEDSQRYCKGAVRNVRRCKKEDDLLLADLIIYDKKLINEIENGKREVSCGYSCTYKENEDGSYSQVDIRGNHVAVVDAGRAGRRVCIKDSENKKKEGSRMENNKKYVYPKKKQSTGSKFLRAIGLKHLAMDADPEDLSDLMDEVSEEYSQEKARDSEESKKEDTTNDESPQIAALNEKIDKLASVVESLVANKDEETPEDAIDTIISEIEDSAEKETDDDEAEVVGDEEIPDGVVSDPDNRPVNPIPNADSKAMIEMLRAVKPIIASIEDKQKKQVATDSITKAFRKATEKVSTKKNSYSDIMNAQKKQSLDNALKQKQTQNYENLGEEIAKKYNANMKGDK